MNNEPINKSGIEAAEEDTAEKIVDDIKDDRGGHKFGKLDLISGVSSITAGTFTSKRIIEEQAYKNLSAMHLWEDIKPTRRAHGHEVLKNAETGKISYPQARNAIREIIMEGESTKVARLKVLGLESLKDQFSILRPHQKTAVIIAGLTTASLGFASLLLLTRDLFSKKDAKEKDEDKGIGR